MSARMSLVATSRRWLLLLSACVAATVVMQQPRCCGGTAAHHCNALRPAVRRALLDSFKRWAASKVRDYTPHELMELQIRYLREAECLAEGTRGRPSWGADPNPSRLHEGQAVEVEIGHLGSPSQSSTSGARGLDTSASAALDGLTLGFVPDSGPADHPEQLHSWYRVAQTALEEDAHWELHLEERSVVISVEVWPPRSVDEAIRQDIMGGRASTRHQGHPFHQELSLGLLDSGVDLLTASATVWSHAVPVDYTWRVAGLAVAANLIRISPPQQATGAHSRAQLTLAEAKVFAIAPWDCSKHCMRGRCTCLDHLTTTDVGLSGGCRETWSGLANTTWWKAGGLSEELAGELSALQRPATCPASAASYAGIMQSGFGSTMMLASAALSDALVQGTTFQPPLTSQFAVTASECKKHQGFDCYLKPWAVLPDGCRTPSLDATARVAGDACGDGLEVCSRMTAIPARYQHRGNFWWRSHLMNYLVRVNKRFREDLGMEKLKHKMGFTHPIIGVHIRHGDSCFLARSGYCRGLEEYLPAIRSASARYGIHRVFVATDNQKVITSLSSTVVPGVRWIFLPIDRSFLHVDKPVTGSGWKASIEKRIRRKELSAYQVMKSTVQDILLLSQADVLIGTGSASFFKLSLLLSAAEKQRVPPYISLDSAYCNSWRMCCNVSPTGRAITC